MSGQLSQLSDELLQGTEIRLLLPRRCEVSLLTYSGMSKTGELSYPKRIC